MYLRRSTRKRADGTKVSYLQLAHNEWDSERKRSVPKILFSFGREDQVDREAMARLVQSLSRVLPAEQALALAGSDEMSWTSSRAVGATWALDRLWHRLGMVAVVDELAEERRLGGPAGRVVFALVAYRALGPSRRATPSSWVADEVMIDRLDELSDEACERVVDWLGEVAGKLTGHVHRQVAELFPTGDELLWVTTLPTSWRSDDSPTDSGSVAVATDRRGLPLRVWRTSPGTSKPEVVAQAKKLLGGRRDRRVTWVAERAATSASERRALKRSGDHYVVSQRVRPDTDEAEAARPGRYTKVTGDLEVKEVTTETTPGWERLIVCRDLDQAARDRAARDTVVTHLEKRLTDAESMTPIDRLEEYEMLAAVPRFDQLMRKTRSGKRRVDRAAVAIEEKVDGAFLLRVSDPDLAMDHAALGQRALTRLGRGWLDLESSLGLDPGQTVRGDLVISWLALLLVRLAEETAGLDWTTIRAELQRMRAGAFDGPAGTIIRRTETTESQARVLAALGVEEPPRVARPEDVAAT